MSNTFKNLVLIPSLFLLSIICAIGFQSGSWMPVIVILLTIEHLYNWNKTLKNENENDFRVFFTDQYTKYTYLAINFTLGLISPFVWKYLGFWIFFANALNFIIFRSLSSVAIKKVASAAPRPSKVAIINNSSWKNNKRDLIEFIQLNQDLIESGKHEEIIESIEYSSFIRSNNATKLIKIILDSDHKEAKKNLDALIKLL